MLGRHECSRGAAEQLQLAFAFAFPTGLVDDDSHNAIEIVGLYRVRTWIFPWSDNDNLALVAERKRLPGGRIT